MNWGSRLKVFRDIVLRVK